MKDPFLASLSLACSSSQDENLQSCLSLDEHRILLFVYSHCDYLNRSESMLASAGFFCVTDNGRVNWWTFHLHWAKYHYSEQKFLKENIVPSNSKGLCVLCLRHSPNSTWEPPRKMRVFQTLTQCCFFLAMVPHELLDRAWLECDEIITLHNCTPSAYQWQTFQRLIISADTGKRPYMNING